MSIVRIAVAIAVIAVITPIQCLMGQRSLGATRSGLEARAEQLEEVAQSNGNSSAKAQAAREAATIRQRLEVGDFKVGDRMLLVVEGEAALSDTFTVGLGPSLSLPTIGDVPLGGVLRSEVQQYLTRRIGQNLRDPVVHVTAFIRLSIVGAVAKPGYYPVPAEALLSDALMAAGGPAPTAKLQGLRIERAGHVILEKKALQQAIAEGRTIDEAGLVAGDQYYVPSGGGSGTRETIGFVALLLTIPLTVYSLTQVF